MDKKKIPFNSYVVTNSLEEFLKAKLILETYFPSVIYQGRSDYSSRIVYITKDGRVRAEHLDTLIYLKERGASKISYKELIENY